MADGASVRVPGGSRGARTTFHVPWFSDCSSRELRFTLGSRWSFTLCFRAKAKRLRAARASTISCLQPASLNKRTHPPFPCLLSVMCVSRPCGCASICRVVCARRVERAQGVVLPAQRMHAAASQLLRLCFVRCLESSFISSLHFFTHYWTLRSQRRGWGPQRTHTVCSRAGTARERTRPRDAHLVTRLRLVVVLADARHCPVASSSCRCLREPAPTHTNPRRKHRMRELPSK